MAVQKKNTRKTVGGKKNEENVEVKALFLGPRSENRDYFKNMLTFIMDEHMHWRRDFHPEDPNVTSAQEMRNEHFQATLDRTTEVLLDLSARLKEGPEKVAVRAAGPCIAGFRGEWDDPDATRILDALQANFGR